MASDKDWWPALVGSRVQYISDGLNGRPASGTVCRADAETAGKAINLTARVPSSGAEFFVPAVPHDEDGTPGTWRWNGLQPR